MKVKVFEAFSGYGSQSNALQKLGVDYEVVATSEIDISAILAYGAMRFNLSDDIDIEDDEIRKFLINKNIGYDFKEEKSKINKLNKDKLHMLYNATVKSKNLGDISIINPQDIPKHDIFTMSSPCQDFSSAGKQEGGMWKCNDCGNEFNPIKSMFNEMCPICKSVNITKTRSSLLFECAKNIKYNKPKVILFENVKNLVGNKFIDIFNEWCKWLESQGYNNTWEIVNSLDYGVPQNRERVIMISILGDIKYVFPKKITLNKKLKDLLDVNIDEKYFVNTERATNLLAKIKEDDSIGYIQQRLGGDV